MSDTKILCGIHALKEKREERYYPVAVYLSTDGNFTERQTCLIRDEVAPTVAEVFDMIDEHMDDCTDEEEYPEWPHFVGDFNLEDVPGSLDSLRLYHPTRNRIGEVIEGTVAGWHIDYRTNYGKSYLPCLIGNICFHDKEGRVNFVTVSKLEIDPKSPQHLRKVMAKAFEAMVDRVQLGGKVIIDVLPVGKTRARFCVKEYIEPPQTIEELVVNVLEEATSKSNVD